VSLLPPERAVLMDLQAAFDRAYDAGPYRKAVRYAEDAIIPPLPAEQAAWVATTLTTSSARSK
jgi:hypothetical protein